jgi:hypothetical protein
MGFDLTTKSLPRCMLALHYLHLCLQGLEDDDVPFYPLIQPRKGTRELLAGAASACPGPHEE